MARLAVADTVTTLVATPHQLGPYARNRGELIRTQTERMQQRLDQEGVALRLLSGAEVRIEPGLVSKIRSGEILTLADRRRHVLLELPHEVYLPIDRLLAEFQRAGLVAILAHPERNLGILARPEIVPGLVRAGCLMQVTAGSLLGGFGPEVQQFAQGLIQQGLAHFLATDAHGTQSRRPWLARGFECVARFAGAEMAADLCCRNPACVAAGSSVVSSRQPSRPRGGRSWFPWRKAG